METVKAGSSTAQVLVGVAVMFGWFVAAAAGLAVWVSRRSDVTPEGDDCSGWCTSERFDAALAAVFLGIPATVAGLVVGAVVLAVVTRRARPGVVAGTVAGLAGLVAGPALVFCALSTWSVIG